MSQTDSSSGSDASAAVAGPSRADLDLRTDSTLQYNGSALSIVGAATTALSSTDAAEVTKLLEDRFRAVNSTPLLGRRGREGASAQGPIIDSRTARGGRLAATRSG